LHRAVRAQLRQLAEYAQVPAGLPRSRVWCSCPPAWRFVRWNDRWW